MELSSEPERQVPRWVQETYDLSFPLGVPQVETHNPTMTIGGLTYTRTLPIWGAAIAMALSLQDPGAYGEAGRTYRCQPGSVNEELQGRKVQISAHGYRQARWRHYCLQRNTVSYSESLAAREWGSSISTPFQIASFLLLNLNTTLPILPPAPRPTPVVSTCQGTHPLGYLLYRCSWDVYVCIHARMYACMTVSIRFYVLCR